MSVVCHNPSRDRHQISNGDRRLDITFTIDWGTTDLRDTNSKVLTFCSFECLSEWATDRAAAHDNTTLIEGGS